MTKSDTKWWKDGVRDNGRGYDMRFLFERPSTKQITAWSQEQKESAIRNLEDMKTHFEGHYNETLKLLKQ